MNHQLVFPVLIGGIPIHNPKCDPERALGPYGTLGAVATSDGSDRWLLSCFHVLCRVSGAMPVQSEEPIYHPWVNPVKNFEPHPVAIVTNDRVNAGLDCAAARVVAGDVRGQILGVGRLNKPIAAQVGMRVLKSGAESGVTEGIVSKIRSSEIEISPINGISGYELSEGGDSGSVWIDSATLAPIGLHYKGSDRGYPERAFAKSIADVLSALQLQILNE